MYKTIWYTIILGLLFLSSCKEQAASQLTEEEVWKLGWRLIESSEDEELDIAQLQFDSLLENSNAIERKFLITGLKIKSKLNKDKEIIEILKLQNNEMLRKLCTYDELKNIAPCGGLSEEKVENKKLQLELIEMYVNDQATRGNVMEDIIKKYEIPKNRITQEGGIEVDKQNRSRLKEIFQEFGFPTKQLVGKDGMYGIFLMLQHSDGDKEWQKSQFSNIESAVKNGDLEGQSYAYLYDRIKINEGSKQLYGSQFSNVDPIAKTVQLADTEDLANLDTRRRKMGMMPIEMYKRFMLKNL